MTPETRLVVNAKFVAYESFDDEVLAVNLETGTYYSLMGSSARIWEAIAARWPLGSIAERLACFYNAPLDQLQSAVETFTAELSTQGLIALAGTDALKLDLPSPVTANKVRFDAPTITVHTDMQDLLLLDPIHDVDEAGWPVFKPDVGPQV